MAATRSRSVAAGLPSSTVSISASICSSCRSCSAAISAFLLGKYWYSDPTLTPAVSAIRLVLVPA